MPPVEQGMGQRRAERSRRTESDRLLSRAVAPVVSVLTRRFSPAFIRHPGARLR